MIASMNRRGMLLGFTGLATVSLLPSVSRADGLPARPSPDVWTRDPALGNIMLSPDGTQIAYTHLEKGNKILYHYDVTKDHLTGFNIGPAEIMDMEWMDNDHIAISFYKALSREAVFGLRSKAANLVLYNLPQRKITTLFSTSTGDERQRGYGWGGGITRIVENGKTYLLTTSYDGPDRKLLVKFPMDSETPIIVDVGSPEVEHWITTRDGKVIGRSEYYWKHSEWVMRYKGDGNWKDVYRSSSLLYSPSLVCLGRDGKSLVMWMQDEGKDGQYYEVDAEGKLTPLGAPGIETGALIDRATLQLAGFATYGDWIDYHYFDPMRQDLAAKAQKAVPGYRMRIAAQADDPHITIVYSEGDDDAGSYYLINFATGTFKELGPIYPEVPVDWITTKQHIAYKAADGTPIEAYLTLPKGRDAKNLPLIMHPHGGPASHDTIAYDWQVQAFASRGYAVLQPNFRGSTGYGEAFERMGDGEYGRKMQTDLSDGVRELVKQGMVDPKRVCIVGTSYGGYAAFAGATIDTGIYNCAVAIAGLSDPVKWMESQRGFDSEFEGAGYAYVKRLLGDSARLDEIRPIKHIDRVTIPILVMHGKDDSVVPTTQSTEMVAALKAAGKPVTFFEIEHAEHGATTEASRMEMLGHTLEFIEKYNPPFLAGEAGA